MLALDAELFQAINLIINRYNLFTMSTTLHPILITIKNQINGGTALLFATLLALFFANSPFHETYFAFFEETVISIDFHFWQLHKNLHHWINDGLMAIFFFHIGLEIKRELIIGELSSVKKALVPFVAAVGGMLIPASVFFALNYDTAEFTNGWAIPMATDIAFALGIISLLGKRVPIEIKVLLTSLAIVDDLGAVLTIAVFYTETILLEYLLIAAIAVAVLFILNKMGVRYYWVYLLVGVLLLWYPMLKSGVHATVAGVLLAFTIPMDRKCDPDIFIQKTKKALRNFIEHSRKENKKMILTPEQYSSLEEIRLYTDSVASPLQRLEHMIHSFSVYIIMPIFAFANTGINFQGLDLGALFQSSLTWGVILGLVLGKVVGIVGALWLFVKIGIISPPSNATKHQIIGAGFLAGIGFTMSIFISDLAFSDDDLTQQAKIAVFAASIVAGTVGFVILRYAKKITEWKDKKFWDL